MVGIDNTYTPVDLTPTNGIVQVAAIGGDAWVPAVEPLLHQRRDGVGPGFAFARAIATNHAGTVALVPVAHGGLQCAHLVARNNPQFVVATNRIAWARTHGAETQALLISIGINDAAAGWPQARAFAGNLATLVARLRSQAGHTVPVAICDLPHISPPTWSDRIAVVRAAISNAPNVIADCEIVQTRGLSLYVDNLHYSAAGSRTLGARFASIVQLTGEDPPPPPPPAPVIGHRRRARLSPSGGAKGAKRLHVDGAGRLIVR